MLAVKGEKLPPAAFARTVIGCQESGTPRLTDCVLDQFAAKGIDRCFKEYSMF